MACRIALALAAILALPPTASSRTWLVLPDGTGDAPSIQAAFDSSATGDIVELGCGAYAEHDLVAGNGITLRSATGDPACVVLESTEPGLSAPSVPFFRIEGITFRGFHDFAADIVGQDALSPVLVRDCIFENVHINALRLHSADAEVTGCVFRDNGVDVSYVSGGGVLSVDGIATFRSCAFLRNTAGRGGGVFGPDVRFFDCEFRSNLATNGGGTWGDVVLVNNCLFEENECSYTGAGLYADDELVVEDCEFRSNVGITVNTAGGAIHSLGVSEIRDSRFLENHTHLGSAVYTNNASTISRCVFLRNRAGAGDLSWNGAGTICFAVATGDRVVEDCTFVANVGTFASAVACDGPTILVRRCVMAQGIGAPVGLYFSSVCPTIECCDMYGNELPIPVSQCIVPQLTTNGNFSADPLFCDPDNDDFTLRADSPCAAPGPTSCGLIGALPVACGAVSVERLSWGKIKGAYR